MSIRIHLHKSHRPLAGGLDSVPVEGRNVGECLAALVGQFPELAPQLFEGKGRLKKTIEIYLNLESAYPDELSKPTGDGDQIHITVLLAGG